MFWPVQESISAYGFSRFHTRLIRNQYSTRSEWSQTINVRRCCARIVGVRGGLDSPNEMLPSYREVLMVDDLIVAVSF